jgi:hypothetical protein
MWLKKRKNTAGMKRKGAVSTAEDQDAFIVRISLEGEVEKLVERKGFRKKGNGGKGKSQNFPLFLQTYNENFLIGIFPIWSG